MSFAPPQPAASERRPSTPATPMSQRGQPDASSRTSPMPWAKFRATQGTGNGIGTAADFQANLGNMFPPSNGLGIHSSRTHATRRSSRWQSTYRHGILVEAAGLGGERKSQVPTWSGAPNLLRQWLKSLGLWEQETSLPKSKWGLRLYAALTDDAKRIADTVPMEELVTERGYSAILTALMSKYKPYSEAVGPSSVGSFLYLGERGPKESFAAYLARKEVQRQELESQIGEKLYRLWSPAVCSFARRT